MSEKQSNKIANSVSDNSRISVPWLPILKAPKLDFRKPKYQLPHEAPQQYLAAILVLFTIFLLAGGLYDLAENPLPLGYTQVGYQPIYPNLNSQFLVESFSIFVLILLGTLGIFLLRQATQQGQSTKPASFMITIGVILILIGVIAAILMIDVKVGGSFLL